MSVLTNLITNPSFEVDTTGWLMSDTPTTFARVTSDAYVGTAALQVTADSFFDGAKFQWTSEANQPYYGAVWIKGTAGDAGRIYLYNGSDMLLTAITLATSGWERWAASGTVVNAGNIDLGIDLITTGSPWLIDACMVVQSAEAVDYFDGNTADGGGFIYDWTGTVNASTSTRTPATANSSVNRFQSGQRRQSRVIYLGGGNG